MLSPQVRMGLQHARLPIGDQGVVELRDIYLVPCLAEYDVAHHYLVFKSGSKAAIGCALFDHFLNLATDATDCAQLSPSELSDFESRVEHALNECSILVDLERLTNQFELLHHFELGIDLYYDSGDTDSEVGDIFACVILKFLHPDEGGTKGIGRAVEGRITETEFGCVLNHSQSLGFYIIRTVDRNCLEFPPPHRENNGILVLQYVGIPSMLLYLYANIRIGQLLMSK